MGAPTAADGGAARVTGARWGGRAPGGQQPRLAGAEPGGGRGERSLRAPGKPRGWGRRPSPRLSSGPRARKAPDGLARAGVGGGCGKFEAGLQTAEPGAQVGNAAVGAAFAALLPRFPGKSLGGAQQPRAGVGPGRPIPDCSPAQRWPAVAGLEQGSSTCLGTGTNTEDHWSLLSQSLARSPWG